MPKEVIIAESVPVSVLISCKNEAANVRQCLDAIAGWAGEIIIVDSHSTDGTAQIAQEYGLDVVQFDYRGGWPKKRQWALDTLPLRNEWVLLLDADEVLPADLREEIRLAIAASSFDGYYLGYRIWFLGRLLRFGDTILFKLSLFRHGKARFECRLAEQDVSMGDMEVHEHVILDGKAGKLKHMVRHENFQLLYRYIEKHNAYSNWEAKTYSDGNRGELRPTLWGIQAQRRRWLKAIGIRSSCFPLAVFVYAYILRLGFLDGRRGFLYCTFKAIQGFCVQAKIEELLIRRSGWGAEHGRAGATLVGAITPQVGANDRAPAAGLPELQVSDLSAYFALLAGSWSKKYGSGGSLAPRIARCLSALRRRQGTGVRVLDFGCGSGEITQALEKSGYSVFGLDSSPAMIDAARRTCAGTGAELIAIEAGRWSKVPVRDETFDAVVAYSVLEYVLDPAEQIRELARVLREGGLCVITVPNRPHPGRIAERLLRMLAKSSPMKAALYYLPKGLREYIGYLRTSVNHFPVSTWIDILGTAGLRLDDVLDQKSPLAEIVAIKVSANVGGELRVASVAALKDR